MSSDRAEKIAGIIIAIATAGTTPFLMANSSRHAGTRAIEPPSVNQNFDQGQIGQARRIEANVAKTAGAVAEGMPKEMAPGWRASGPVKALISTARR